jgi:hypothetical protein
MKTEPTQTEIEQRCRLLLEDTPELPSRALLSHSCIYFCRITGWSLTLRRLSSEAAGFA